jgi:hypothetical protein
MIDISTWTVSSHICTAGADNSISFKPNLQGSIRFHWSKPRLKGSNLSAIKPLVWKCKGRPRADWNMIHCPSGFLTSPSPTPLVCVYVQEAPILTKNDVRLITKGHHVRSAVSFLTSRREYFPVTINPQLSNSLHERLEWFQLMRQY